MRFRLGIYSPIASSTSSADNPTVSAVCIATVASAAAVAVAVAGTAVGADSATVAVPGTAALGVV